MRGAGFTAVAPAPVEAETELGVVFCAAACVTQALEFVINNAATRTFAETDTGNRQPEIMHNLFPGLSDLFRVALRVFELPRVGKRHRERTRYLSRQTVIAVTTRSDNRSRLRHTYAQPSDRLDRMRRDVTICYG